ncbi:hypothetical protein LTR62_006349 [Meristemomyces frigidus]|uniref:Peptidase A1 domain-containing protein n=1 Tax=Meristemomyces frigidus TaxID=1508187 RepID=A0AAN7TCX9_9PEZI|nr:hypothetical protein LTR62_006349 [Meristemomyces frigidus]
MARAACALLLAGLAVAQKANIPLPDVAGTYAIERLPASSRHASLTDLTMTDNVVNLRRGTGWSSSAAYLQALRREEDAVDSVRTANGSVNLLAGNAGSVFLAPIVVGGQSFDVVIDTGSSDPWLVISNFECIDVYNGSQASEGDCGFGPTYNPAQSSTYAILPNENFAISYADGESATGSMGYETFRMGGITVPKQEFGLVNSTAWNGDGVSSGLVGFASGAITSAYPGDNSSADTNVEPLFYNPLFYNMFQKQGVLPVFSLAINRDYTNGGVLALGGLPDVPYSPGFASTPIIPSNLYNQTSGQYLYEFYTVVVNGFGFSNSNSTRFNVLGVPNSQKKPLAGNGTLSIVDSGTSIIFVDNATLAQPTAMLFSPPGTWNPEYSVWNVACNATPPIFGVSIANKMFYVNPADMIVEQGPGFCISGVQASFGNLTILGDVWMKNVLCVFDLGAEMMRFAAREFDGLTASAIKKPNT